MSLLAAYKKLKMARGCVAPNFSFLFLLFGCQMSLLAAYKKLKMARGCVAPNFSFWQQLVDAELSLASGQCVSILFYRIFIDYVT
jgi:hypothetical protein